MDTVCEKENLQVDSCCRKDKKKICNRNDDEIKINQKSGKEISGLTHECGVFGALACGDWPTDVTFY